MEGKEQLLAEIKEQNKAQLDEFRTELAEKTNDKTLEEAIAKAEELLDNYDIKENPDFVAMKQMVDIMKSKQTEQPEKAVTFAKALKDSQEKINTDVRNGREIEIKAVTMRAAVVDSKKNTTLTSIGQLAVRTMPMLDLIQEINVSNNDDNGEIYYYDWNESTIARAAKMLEEGEVFPESTAKWQWYKVSFKKVGDSIPVTDEFFEDAAPFAAEIEGFVQTNVELAEDKQLLNGDGVDENIKGLDTYAGVYTPVAGNIQDANIYDLIKKMKTAITKKAGNKYRPNFVLANADVIDDMILEKDANNNYLRPEFLRFTPEGYPIVHGLVVIENNEKADNTLTMGDAAFAKRYTKRGYTMKYGWIDDDFARDQQRLKISKRTTLLVRKVDEGAFLKCVDINAALTVISA